MAVGGPWYGEGVSGEWHQGITTPGGYAKLSRRRTIPQIAHGSSRQERGEPRCSSCLFALANAQIRSATKEDGWQVATARAAIEDGTTATSHARVEAMLRAHHGDAAADRTALERVAGRGRGRAPAGDGDLRPAARLARPGDGGGLAEGRRAPRGDGGPARRGGGRSRWRRTTSRRGFPPPRAPSRSGSSARSARRTRSRRSGGSSRTSARRCCSRRRASPIARSASARAGRTRRSTGPSPRGGGGSSTRWRGSSRARSASGTPRRCSR